MKTHVIYIVDDSKIIADILNKMIASLDHVTAVNFLDAESMLEKMKKREPDMIFIDYYISKGNQSSWNGETLFQEIKRINNEIPVILLTGMTDMNKLEELRSVGFSDIIHKDEFDIFTKVISIVGRHLKLPSVN